MALKPNFNAIIRSTGLLVQEVTDVVQYYDLEVEAHPDMASYIIGEEKWGLAEPFPYRVSGAAAAVYSEDEIIVCGGSVKQDVHQFTQFGPRVTTVTHRSTE